MKITVNCDGGARGNPGPAGIGIVIEKRDDQDNRDKQDKREISKYIGIATNNQAEYRAVIEALSWLKENIKEADLKIDFLLDSELVVEQLNGRYKVKNEGLKPLYQEVQSLIDKINCQISFRHIGRAENAEADKLVNDVLDKPHANNELN